MVYTVGHGQKRSQINVKGGEKKMLALIPVLGIVLDSVLAAPLIVLATANPILTPIILAALF